MILHKIYTTKTETHMPFYAIYDGIEYFTYSKKTPTNKWSGIITTNNNNNIELKNTDHTHCSIFLYKKNNNIFVSYINDAPRTWRRNMFNIQDPDKITENYKIYDLNFDDTEITRKSYSVFNIKIKNKQKKLKIKNRSLDLVRIVPWAEIPNSLLLTYRVGPEIAHSFVVDYNFNIMKVVLKKTKDDNVYKCCWSPYGLLHVPLQSCIRQISKPVEYVLEETDKLIIND